jgi:hypothetical protein
MNINLHKGLRYSTVTEQLLGVLRRAMINGVKVIKVRVFSVYTTLIS